MSGFMGACKCFRENVTLVGSQPMSDPQNWNLNNGLEQFVVAVERDLAEMNRKLNTILTLINR